MIADEMIEKAKQERREYMREYMKGYRKENKEKLKEYSKKWREDFKDRNGISYNEALGLRKAMIELEERLKDYE